jgi:hypothetical protein
MNNSITASEILPRLQSLGIERKTFEAELILNSGDFSSYLTGKKEIPATRQSQIFWYFRAKELEKKELDLQEVSEGIIIREYKSITDDLWAAMIRLQNVRGWGRDFALLTETINITPGEENYLTAEEQELNGLYLKAWEILRNHPFWGRYVEPGGGDGDDF